MSNDIVIVTLASVVEPLRAFYIQICGDFPSVSCFDLSILRRRMNAQGVVVPSLVVSACLPPE